MPEQVNVCEPFELAAHPALIGLRSVQQEAHSTPLRGEPAIDRERLIDALVGLGRAAQDDPNIQSIDVNPLIVCNGIPIAVDALVELGETNAEAVTNPTAETPE